MSERQKSPEARGLSPVGKQEGPPGPVGGSLPPVRPWRGAALITVGALALYAGFRALPTGTNLHHMDFRVSGANALEMCDPSRPQFIPVVAARSPVTAELRVDDAGAPVPVIGRPTRFVLRLATSAGKPIGPVDLLLVHTRRLHLLVIDETLRDYQHLHPEPGSVPGEWVFTHTPRGGDGSAPVGSMPGSGMGVTLMGLTRNYRVFADFTPVVTGRGLYAYADYQASNQAVASPSGAVASAVAAAEGVGDSPVPARESAHESAGEPVDRPPLPLGVGAEEGAKAGAEAATGTWRFRLATQDGAPVRAGVATTLVFSGREVTGGAVPMTLVMDAYAHLVAFDADRSGFAHLHPRGAQPGDVRVTPPDPREPQLFFDLMIPKAGAYVVWAQVNLQGRERFMAYDLTVVP